MQIRRDMLYKKWSLKRGSPLARGNLFGNMQRYVSGVSGKLALKEGQSLFRGHLHGGMYGNVSEKAALKEG